MNWLLVAAVIVGLGGLGLGAYMAARNAEFWIGLIKVLVKAALPAILAQMSPKELEELNMARRLGTDDDYMQAHLRKKLKPIFGGRNAGSR